MFPSGLRFLFVCLARVGVAIGVFKVLSRYVGVDLGGGEVGMAQELLDGVDVGPVVEHVGGKAMTEDVWRHPVGMRQRQHIAFHRLADVITRERRAIIPDEKDLRTEIVLPL